MKSSTPDSHTVKLIKTALCVVSFLGLGGCNTLLGSSLLDLQIRIGQSFATTSNLVPARSIGYILGGMASSFIDRWFGTNIIMVVTNLVAGLAIAIAPWFTSYQLMAAFILTSGFAQGIFDIICNTFILKIWKNDKSLANYVQTLHGAFGIGALITPLISQPFLLPLSEDIGDGQDDAAILGDYTPNNVKVQWAFLTITMFLFISSAGFLFYFFKDRSKQLNVNKVEEKTDGDEPPRWKINLTIVLLCLLANPSFGILTLVGSLAPAFVVKSDLHLSKKAGATMVTVFWIVLSIYKASFVIASNFVSEDRLMMFSYFCQLTSIFFIVPHAAYNVYCNWIGFNLLGIGFAPLFAVALSRVQRFFTLTNGLASFVFVNGCIGEAIHPWIASRLLNFEPIFFTYYLGALALIIVFACNLSIFVSQWLFKNEKKRDISRTGSIRSWTR